MYRGKVKETASESVNMKKIMLGTNLIPKGYSNKNFFWCVRYIIIKLNMHSCMSTATLDSSNWYKAGSRWWLMITAAKQGIHSKPQGVTVDFLP